MKYRDKKAILGTTLRTEEGWVEQWDGMVRIQEPSLLTGSLIAGLPDDTPLSHKTAWWVVMCAVDKQGERLFTADDVPALAEKSSGAVTFLANRIMDLFSSSEKKEPLEASSAPTSD